MSSSIRRWRGRTGAMVVVGAVLLAACGGKGTTGTSGGGGTPAGHATVDTSSVSDLGTVIANAQGFTLYHLKTEVGGKIACTGSCTSVWPPLLLSSGSTSPTAGPGVTGHLATITRPDGGIQVTYDGLPLYRYSGDGAAGQANGQGIQNVWFAITPSGALAGAGGAGGSSPTSGGYGY